MAQSKNPLLDTLLSLTGNRNTITVHRPVVEFLEGNFEAALLLEQLLYWTPKASERGGWVAKSYADWKEEIYLARYSVEKARKYLKKRGLVTWEIRRFNNSPTAFYKVDMDALAREWETFLLERKAKAETTEDQAEDRAEQPESEPESDGEAPAKAPAEINRWSEGEEKAPAEINRWSGNPEKAPAEINRWSEGEEKAPAEISRWSGNPEKAPAEINRSPAEISRSLTEITTENITPRDLRLTTTITTTTTAKPSPRLQRTSGSRKPAVVADVVADGLPGEIIQALKVLGWVGSTAEIARAWAENPDRVRAWLDYAYSHNWSAALLRHTLRTDPGMPPRPAEQARLFAAWEGVAENVNTDDDGNSNGNGKAPPQDMGEGVPVPTTPLPDMGDATPAAGYSPPPSPPLPPDVQRWWKMALGQLQADMPKAAFDTWVRPACPTAWRDEDGQAVLTVAVANDYARQWLQERVARILAQKLTGLVGKPVSLDVVVG